MAAPVRFGVDLLCDGDGVRTSTLGSARRVGLVTNDAARLARDSSVPGRLALRAAGVPLVRLFGPEHGLAATAADGAAVGDSTDTLTGLPVLSLYGTRMRPPAESLADLDAALFDVPDVGARCYTYTWTLFHLMAACEEAGVRVVVLDRPNPLGGELTAAEGPMLDSAFRSFIGEDRIPLRHQLTLGELARLWQRERYRHVQLEVVPCAEWTRAMRWDATGLPWVATSPAMPTFDSAEVYPGTCLFEATNLSVGRGSDAPFQQVGAPWLDGDAVVDVFEREAIAGVRCESVVFTPSIAPYARERCQGVRVHITDAVRARPVALGLQLLAAVACTHPERFRWATYPTAANPSGEGHFERLLGRADVREAIDDCATRRSCVLDTSLLHEWTATGDWNARVQDVLLYR